MAVVSHKYRRVLMWFLLTLLFAGLVYAGAELMGQANKNAADAGSTGADMEMASLDSIKQSKSNPVNWSEEQRLHKKINALDSEYKTHVNKARSEAASAGSVSAGTRSAGIACADRYQKACEDYASFWDKNNGKTRARLARETGKSRIANAQMTFNDVDSSRISAYNDQQDALAKARRAYLDEAKTDVSDADRGAIKSALQPRLNKMTGDVQNLISSVTSLLDQVKGQAGGMGVGAIGGCAKSVATGGGAAGGASALLSPLTNLLSLAKSLGSNVTSMLSDIQAL